MNILVATKHLRNYAGSEIFTRDLVFALRDCGHKVFVFSKELGPISDEIFHAGISITNNLNDYAEEKFDIVHAQHSITTVLARSFLPNVPIVFLAHGIISDFERLPKINLGISFYLGVSEEVVSYNFLSNKSIKPEQVKIARNFIDTDKFFSVKPVNEKPKKLLVLSNHYIDSVKNNVEVACKDLGIDIIHVGKPENPQKDVVKFINEADIVVSLGRGILETAACERNAIIYDWSGGDGFVDEKNFYEARKSNFSGREKRKKYSPTEFKNEILKYDPSLGKKLRGIIIQEHSREQAINYFEEIYKKAIENFSNKYKKDMLSRILLNKKIALSYVLFIVFVNKILKIFRIAGLRKF